MTISIPSRDSFEPANTTNAQQEQELEQTASSKDLAIANPAAYVSPAHSSLIPTSQLEVMYKEARDLMHPARIQQTTRIVGTENQLALGNNFASKEAADFLTDFFGIELGKAANDTMNITTQAQGEKAVGTRSSIRKRAWNINAPPLVPSAPKHVCDAQSVEEGGDPKKKVLVSMYPNAPTDGQLLENMDLHDTRGILERQNSPLKELPQKVSIVPPGFVDGDSEYKDEDQESMAYNFMEESRCGGLSPRLEHVRKPKLVKKERAPLERRVQPLRSSESKSTCAK